MAKGSPKDSRSLTGAEVKANFVPITEALLEECAAEDSLARGRSYFRNDYIKGMVLRGRLLRGLSMGQSGGPYNVQISLVPIGEPVSKAIDDYKCSCPRGDFCKHLVALAMCWMRKPQYVEVRADIGDMLQDKSRDELLALLAELVKKNPDLDGAIEKILLVTAPRKSTPGTANKLTINQSKIKREISSAFGSSRDYYDWDDEEYADVAESLGEFVEMADGYAKVGQWANATVVYTLVAEEVIEHYEELEDEGEISDVIMDCAEGLVESLDAQTKLEATDRLGPIVRLGMLNTLFEIWQHLNDYGGWELEEGLDEIYARTASQSEKSEIEDWIRTAIGEARSDGYGYARGRLVQLLLDVKAEKVTDEETLEEYRNAGMTQAAANQLIRMGRLDDALAELQSAGMYSAATSMMAEHGRIEEAIEMAWKRIVDPQAIVSFGQQLVSKDGEWEVKGLKFVEDKLWEEKDPKRSEIYLEWLEGQYRRLNRAKQTLDIAMSRFKLKPGQTTYEAVKSAAEMKGHEGDVWAGIRSALIKTLEARKDWGTLVSIYLKEKATAEAIDAYWQLERATKPERTIYSGTSSYYVYSHLPRFAEPVAQAAEKEYPEKARQIYARIAELYIDFRGRENYQMAARCLGKVRDLYNREGKIEEWQKYIEDVKVVNKSLRALKEELEKAKL